MVSKVIIVTGASRGIGLAVARYLLEASHKVILVARTASELESLKTRYPSQVEYLAADLTDLNVAPKITDLAVKSFGRLDGVVINHGVLSPMKRIADSNVEDWKRHYDVNLFSAVALIKEGIPLLRETHGRIVFTSSGAAFHAYASWGPYGSSKSAMFSLVQHLAVEEPLISTIAISPGRCDTAMQEELRNLGTDMAEDDRAGFVDAYKEGKLIKPELPAQVMAKLVLEVTPDLSGKYYSWSASELAAFRDQA